MPNQTFAVLEERHLAAIAVRLMDGVRSHLTRSSARTVQDNDGVITTIELSYQVNETCDVRLTATISNLRALRFELSTFYPLSKSRGVRKHPLAAWCAAQDPETGQLLAWTRNLLSPPQAYMYQIIDALSTELPAAEDGLPDLIYVISDALKTALCLAG
jgi:hypothetical protein